MNEFEKFEEELQVLARFTRVISHPARLAILKYMAKTKTCISGKISDYLPLSHTNVSQYLKELIFTGLIQGEIEAPYIKKLHEHRKPGESQSNVKRTFRLIQQG